MTAPLTLTRVAVCIVENLSYKKESWINNRRQHKRHVGSAWQRGHAARAVDGDVDQSLQRCIALDNFYVERPTLKIDLGRRTLVTGLVIVTWQGKGQGGCTPPVREKHVIHSVFIHTCNFKTLSPPILLRFYSFYALSYWSNPPFLIVDIRALWRSGLSARAPECQKLKMMG